MKTSINVLFIKFNFIFSLNVKQSWRRKCSSALQYNRKSAGNKVVHQNVLNSWFNWPARLHLSLFSRFPFLLSIFLPTAWNFCSLGLQGTLSRSIFFISLSFFSVGWDWGLKSPVLSQSLSSAPIYALWLNVLLSITLILLLCCFITTGKSSTEDFKESF